MLFSVAALDATEYWYVSAYIVYATLPIIVISGMFRPIGTVVRIAPFWVMLALLAWMYVVSVLSSERRLALGHMWFVTKIWSIALLLIATSTNYKQLALYLKAIVLGALITAGGGALVGFSAAQLGGERVVGITRQTNAFGTALLHGLLAGIILFPYAGKRWKIVVGVYMIAAFVAMLASGSRGAAAAALVAFVAYAVLEHVGRAWKKPVAMISAGVTIVAPFLLAAWLFPRSPLVTRSADLITGRTGATSGRWEIYQQSWELFLSHPFLGTGMGTYRAYGSFVYTHTTFFDLLVGGGVLAFVLYYALYVYAWRKLTILARIYAGDPRWRKTFNAWRAALIAMVAHGAFAPVYFHKIPCYLIAAVTGFAFRHLWELARYRKSA